MVPENETRHLAILLKKLKKGGGKFAALNCGEIKFCGRVSGIWNGTTLKLKNTRHITDNGTYLLSGDTTISLSSEDISLTVTYLNSDVLCHTTLIGISFAANWKRVMGIVL